MRLRGTGCSPRCLRRIRDTHRLHLLRGVVLLDPVVNDTAKRVRRFEKACGGCGDQLVNARAAERDHRPRSRQVDCRGHLENSSVCHELLDRHRGALSHSLVAAVRLSEPVISTRFQRRLHLVSRAADSVRHMHSYGLELVVEQLQCKLQAAHVCKEMEPMPPLSSSTAPSTVSSSITAYEGGSSLQDDVVQYLPVDAGDSSSSTSLWMLAMAPRPTPRRRHIWTASTPWIFVTPQSCLSSSPPRRLCH